MNRFRALLGAAALVAALPAAAADNVRLVLKGYDPVAYFTDGKPVKGDPRYAFEWDDGRYHFASAKHREIFTGDPERYAPQFGGYCTGSMSRGIRKEGDPEAWVVRDGKLYVFADKKFKPMAESDPDFIPSRYEKARSNYRAAR